MHTEETFKDLPLEVLFDLMFKKLQEVEQLEEEQKDIELRISKLNEVELIQKIIDEKKGAVS